MEIGYSENSSKDLSIFIEFKDKSGLKNIYHLNAETARWAADNLLQNARQVEERTSF